MIGITGSMGCGKSTVTRLFAEHGARVLDSDRMARGVVEPGSVGWREVVDRFGESILAVPATGETPPIDRKKLAQVVFADPDQRRALEAIIHPRVARLRPVAGRGWW